MLTIFGKIFEKLQLQQRSMLGQRKPKVGVADTLKNMPQYISDIVIQLYQSLLLIIINAQLDVSYILNKVAKNYNRFYNWWRDPHPYSIYGLDFRREVFGFVFMSSLATIGLLVRYVYRDVLRSYTKQLGNVLYSLLHGERNAKQWKVVARSELSIRRFEFSAKSLINVEEWARNFPDLTREEKMEEERRWQRTLRRINELIGVEPE